MRQLCAIGRDARARVVLSSERDALRAIAWLHANAVDLRTAGAIRGEVELTAIRSPGGLGIDRGIIGDSTEILRGEIENIDVGLPPLPPNVSASFLPSGDQAGAPLMPARADTFALTGSHPLHEHGGSLALERDVREPLPVGSTTPAT